MNDGLITLLTVKATDPSTGKFNINEFAELVVKECRLVVMENLHECTNTIQMDKVLKNHFGAEW